MRSGSVTLSCGSTLHCYSFRLRLPKHATDMMAFDCFATADLWYLTQISFQEGQQMQKLWETACSAFPQKGQLHSASFQSLRTLLATTNPEEYGIQKSSSLFSAFRRNPSVSMIPLRYSDNLHISCFVIPKGKFNSFCYDHSIFVQEGAFLSMIIRK